MLQLSWEEAAMGATSREVAGGTAWALAQAWRSGKERTSGGRCQTVSVLCVVAGGGARQRIVCRSCWA
jgi:hypothetical protein